MEVNVKKRFNKFLQNKDYGLVQVSIWNDLNHNITIVNSVQIVSCVLKIRGITLVKYPRFTLVLLTGQKAGNVMGVLHVKYNILVFLRNLA